MENFQSGDHQFVLLKCDPKATKAGNSYLNLVLDVPFTAELYEVLGKFIFKDIKLCICQKGESKKIESEFYVVNVKPVDYKEGARLRIPLNQPFERNVYLRIAKLWDHDVEVEIELMQKELGLESEENDE